MYTILIYAIVNRVRCVETAIGPFPSAESARTWLETEVPSHRRNDVWIVPLVHPVSNRPNLPRNPGERYT